MNRVISFFSGAIMGAIVGATLTLIFTPASGEELRSRIQELSKRIQLEIELAAQNRRHELEEQLSNLRQPPKSI